MEHKMVKERHSRDSKFEILRIFSIFVIIIKEHRNDTKT